MSDCFLLPATTYQPPTPQPRKKCSPNSTTEKPERNRCPEKGWDNYETRNMHSSMQGHKTGQSAKTKVVKVVRWLSPVSDHFPTSDSADHLSAPALLGTQSGTLGECDMDDDSSDVSSAPSSDTWHRESVMTDVTEFEVSDVSDLAEEETSRRPSVSPDGGLALALVDVIRPGKKITSVPPTPSSAVELSSSLKSMMQTRQKQNTPDLSAPPSLDGSLDSEELAVLSPPLTPVVETDEDESWSGLRLRPAALETLDTLRALVSREVGPDDDGHDGPDGHDYHDYYHYHNYHHYGTKQVLELRPEMSEISETRRLSSRSVDMPSSVRLGRLSKLIKLEMPDIPSPAGFFSDLSSASRETWLDKASRPDSAAPTSTTAEDFYRMPWRVDDKKSASPPPPAVPGVRAEARTEMWLTAQGAYLQGVVDFSEHDTKTVGYEWRLEPEVKPEAKPEAKSVVSPEKSIKKSVRFSEASVRQYALDAFVQQKPRFEALQAQRVSLKDGHRKQLLGQDRVVKPYEAEAVGRMDAATWHVAATFLLNGGHLMAAPLARQMADTVPLACSALNILDLADQGSCDWAWHAARQFPRASVLTVATEAIGNGTVRRPANHSLVIVDRLTSLPFEDDYFDLISARNLHALLRSRGEMGVDEWDTCLRECARVLKPGGFLDFSLLDADLVNAGRLGHAKSVEFAFSLHTLGYDPRPTRNFIRRLAAAGFEDMRRAWVCLPVGPRCRRGEADADVANAAEAMLSGSADGAAAVTGLAAGWSWERWLLRTDMERTAAGLRLREADGPNVHVMPLTGDVMADVPAIMEESRATGGAFRMLRGYARKPGV